MGAVGACRSARRGIGVWGCMHLPCSFLSPPPPPPLSCPSPPPTPRPPAPSSSCHWSTCRCICARLLQQACRAVPCRAISKRHPPPPSASVRSPCQDQTNGNGKPIPWPCAPPPPVPRPWRTNLTPFCRDESSGGLCGIIYISSVKPAETYKTELREHPVGQNDCAPSTRSILILMLHGSVRLQQSVPPPQEGAPTAPNAEACEASASNQTLPVTNHGLHLQSPHSFSAVQTGGLLTPPLIVQCMRVVRATGLQSLYPHAVAPPCGSAFP